MQSKTQGTNLRLNLSGKRTYIAIPAGWKPAHGLGRDGTTKVESLSTATSPAHPGEHFFQDRNGHKIMATADELFVALQQISPDYDIVATKKTS